MEKKSINAKWLEQCFLQWGQTQLADVIARFEDGEAEKIADEEFADFAQEFSTTTDQPESDSSDAKFKACSNRIQFFLTG